MEVHCHIAHCIQQTEAVGTADALRMTVGLAVAASHIVVEDMRVPGVPGYGHSLAGPTEEAAYSRIGYLDAVDQVEGYCMRELPIGREEVGTTVCLAVPGAVGKMAPRVDSRGCYMKKSAAAGPAGESCMQLSRSSAVDMMSGELPHCIRLIVPRWNSRSSGSTDCHGCPRTCLRHRP